MRMRMRRRRRRSSREKIRGEREKAPSRNAR
jgi:hypothetical protein